MLTGLSIHSDINLTFKLLQQCAFKDGDVFGFFFSSSVCDFVFPLSDPITFLTFSSRDKSKESALCCRVWTLGRQPLCLEHEHHQPQFLGMAQRC